MFEGVDKPAETAVSDPQALIKISETNIINFFIDLSDYVILN